jgi:hypothetical protein
MPKVSYLDQVLEQRSAPVFCVRPGKLSSPISKFLYRLCAPLRWWSHSTARIVVHTLRTLPLRIAATRKARRDFLEGLPLQSYPTPACMESLYEESMLPHFCMTDMEKLSMERKFFEDLDQQTFVLGFRAGVESVFRTVDTREMHKARSSS